MFEPWNDNSFHLPRKSIFESYCFILSATDGNSHASCRLKLRTRLMLIDMRPNTVIAHHAPKVQTEKILICWLHRSSESVYRWKSLRGLYKARVRASLLYISILQMNYSKFFLLNICEYFIPYNCFQKAWSNFYSSPSRDSWSNDDAATTLIAGPSD